MAESYKRPKKVRIRGSVQVDLSLDHTIEIADKTEIAMIREDPERMARHLFTNFLWDHFDTDCMDPDELADGLTLTIDGKVVFDG